MKRSVKFCPNCGSTNIKWLNPQMWSIWKCWDCGYIGAVVIEDGDMAEEVRKIYLKKMENENIDSDEDESITSSNEDKSKNSSNEDDNGE